MAYLRETDIPQTKRKQMQNEAKSSSKAPRVFSVGIVGASKEAFAALSRIFAVTRYRTRSYRPVPISANARQLDESIDFVILCTNNPNVLKHWLGGRVNGRALGNPLIRVSRSAADEDGSYVVTVPVNPGRLLQQLDQYTIKELNFFPEFQIGEDNTAPCAATIAGIELLRRSGSGSNKRRGLQRALVVDDSLAVRKQIEIEFSLLDTEVDCVASAEEGLIWASRAAYDIIFLDVVMPGMDGYTACKKIKRSPLTRHTPVVLLTSRSSSFDKIKGTLAGCDTYLVKPISHNDFEVVINKYFSQIRTISK